MATLARHDSTRQYSWLWVSHISPKNSKWLQENLSDMDTKVKAMIKLINEDADSFARRAEMYYKKRPELMKLVEEFYRAYRALAERYDQATGALRQAHRTISEAFPNQMPSMSDESPSSSNQEMEPHTPNMPTSIRAQFDSDDLSKAGVGMSPQHFTSERNGTHPEEISALSSREGLKLFGDLSSSGDNAHRSGFDGKVRKGLTFESPEAKGKDGISNDMVNLQQEVSRLLAESQSMKQQISSESERANKAENEIQILKETVLQLNSDKDTSILQYNQSTERISTLEAELSKARADLRKLTDEMTTGVQKLMNAETLNIAMKSEVEGLEQKMKMQQEKLEKKVEELERFRLSFQEEHEKRVQADTALLSQQKELALSHEEVQRLNIEIKMANEKLSMFKQTKQDLEDTVSELKKDVESLMEQNHSSDLLIQELHDEINTLKYSKNELQTEIQGLKNTISQLNTERNAALLQHQQSVEEVFIYETQLSKLQSEREEIEQKVQTLMQDLEQKREEANSVHAQLQDECYRHKETEATLLTTVSRHLQLQEEVKTLTHDLDQTKKKWSELENEKSNLENTLKELNSTILDLKSVKDAASVQEQQSLEKISDLELELSKAQLELEKSKQQVQLLEQEVAKKNETVDSLELSLKDEVKKRLEAQVSLESVENMYSQSQDNINGLHLEIKKLNGKLNELEKLSSELESTISLLNAEKDATLLLNQKSSAKLSDLESELVAVKSELENVEGKVQILEKELKYKKEEVDNLQISLQDESQKRAEGEASLLLMTNLRSESQEEVNRLALEMQRLTSNITDLENSKVDLENIIAKHTEEIHILHEQNLSTELMIKSLHRELDALKELNVKLESEMGLHVGEKEALHRDFACQREEKENLEGIHHALVYEMDALKNNAATNRKLIKELQIMNSKLKEVCAKNEVEKALLAEKVREVEKLSEEYSLLENSLSDANDEMDSLREKIKALEASENSLKEAVSCHVSEKAVLASELESLGKILSDVSEKNSILHISLSERNTELEELRKKLKDSEESCQHHITSYADLSAEKGNLFSQLESITMAMKALEIKHTDLEDKHSSIIKEKKFAHDQARELQDELRTKIEEYELAVKSHQLKMSSCEKQISSLQEENHNIEEMLQHEQQKNLSASITIAILENILTDEKDKKVVLLNECKKNAVANHSANMLTSQLLEEVRNHEEERKTLLVLNEKLRSAISHQMKVLNICNDSVPDDFAQDEVMLQTFSDEICNIQKLKEECEDMNILMYAELSVLSTLLSQVGMELKDLHLQKLSLENEAENRTAESYILQNKQHLILEQNEQLGQELQKSNEREEALKTEVAFIQKKLYCLRESYQTSQNEISNLTKKNESVSKEFQSLSKRCNSLEEENGKFLAECMMLEHLCLFFRGHNNEVASALASLTEEMALLSLVKGDLDLKVNELNRRLMVLESENNHLKECLIYLLEILRTRLVLSEFDLNTNNNIYQELAIELENCMAMMMQKDNELLEAKEMVQFLQEKNRKLCGVVESLQVAIEGAKVVKRELEKEVTALSEQCAAKDDEILHLHQANGTLQSEVEQYENEFAVLMGAAITSSVSATVYEEKVLKLMMERKALHEVVLNAKERHDQELTKSAAMLAAANTEIQDIKARGSSRMEAKEIYFDNGKDKVAERSKGKQVQMVKDIELDQISTCPPYGAGATLYRLGNGATAELDDDMLQLWETAERNCKNETAKSSSSEHDIQAVEEVKSEHPSSELLRIRDLGISKLAISRASVEPHEVWSKNVLDRLTSDAQRLLSVQASIEELKRKMEGPSPGKGKSPMSSEYSSVSAQLHETEGYVLEQINFNNKLTKKAETYPALSDSMNAEQEGFFSRRKISEQVQKGSENVARLELELQKVQYVLLKLEEEQEYRKLKVSDKRTRVLLRDYLYGRRDRSGGQKKKKRAPFCGCVRPKSRMEA